MRIPASQGLTGWVAQSGQPVAISDVSSDPRFSRQAAEQTGYVPQAILAELAGAFATSAPRSRRQGLGLGQRLRGRGRPGLCR